MCISRHAVKKVNLRSTVILRSSHWPSDRLSGADPGFVHRGGVYFERSSRRAKRVKKQLGVRGALQAPRKILKFRASESESERSLTNYFLFFGVLFY